MSLVSSCRQTIQVRNVEKRTSQQFTKTESLQVPKERWDPYSLKRIKRKKERGKNKVSNFGKNISTTNAI